MRIAIEKLDTLAAAKILVIGDAILDRYTFGVAERVSQEAPVLVLRADQREVRPGGAASVASLLRGLGADVTLAGVVGDDAAGRTLRALLEGAGIETEFLLADPNRPTTTKQRFLGRAANRHPQQMLRVDHELREPIEAELEERLAAAAAARCQAVLVSDYAKGVCTPRLLKNVMAVGKGRHVAVIVDPARTADYEAYRGARMVVPNRSEAELATGIPIHSPADALRAGARLCEEHDFWAALVKLDADGIAVVNPEAGIAQHMPARQRAVCDVTGAGDMVLAIVGLCQAARWGVAETAALANIAAGLEVERLGVAPVSWDEIRAELQRGPTYFPSPRTLSVDTTVVRGEGQAEGRLLGPYGPLTLTLSPHDRRNGSMTCGARGHERCDDRGDRETG
jgi:D-beta-D-heptose 7-phosphate kinase/D-beta-D-heptose 1-phosphate adenosyltransferase